MGGSARALGIAAHQGTVDGIVLLGDDLVAALLGADALARLGDMAAQQVEQAAHHIYLHETPMERPQTQ